jgi:hypothetical protein
MHRIKLEELEVRRQQVAAAAKAKQQPANQKKGTRK